MDDARFVRRLQRLGELYRDWHRLGEGDRSPRQAFVEPLPLDQLHDQNERSLHVLEPVEGRNVRVIECRQKLRLALEASVPLGIGSQVSGDDLERHLPAEAGIAGAPDLTHGSGAKLTDHPVRADLTP